jgi:hypothetical protein
MGMDFQRRMCHRRIKGIDRYAAKINRSEPT